MSALVQGGNRGPFVVLMGRSAGGSRFTVTLNKIKEVLIVETIEKEINAEEMAKQLWNVRPSSMSLEDRLETLPGAIYDLDRKLEKLSDLAATSTGTCKTLEDREFYKLKGTKNPKTEKLYTEAEAKYVAVQVLKGDSELYQNARANEKRYLEEKAEKSRLREFYDRMECNAKYLVRLKTHRDLREVD